jgi:transposase
MPKRIRLRTLTTEEEKSIRRLARSRTTSARLVQRAKIIESMHEDPDLPATRAAQRVGLSIPMGPIWVRRFNAEGAAGLEDKPRSGKPATLTEKERSQVIDLALQKPRSLGYPYELWTLSRLQAAIEERYGLILARSTIWTWLKEEGLNWKRQQSWFHDPEKHDPEFVEKRGPSSASTSSHRP